MSAIPALRFLVVEDHAFQRWLIGSLLEGLGAEAVYLAEDGSEALRMLSRVGNRVDIVVSDLDMPGMDGMQFIRHLGERRHPAALIVLSALQSPLLASVETMAREYGVAFLATIPKPLTARKLQAAIEGYRPAGPPADETPAKPSAHSAAAIAAGLQLDEFEAYFQPIVEVVGERLRGAEALVRWNHPSRGLLEPPAFIESVEARGFMDALTRKVVRAASTHCRIWRDVGLDVGVSVNLSTSLLSDARLADRLTEIATSSGLEPRYLTFEVTETGTARNPARKLENLARLRMRGFGLSIDDYGTGYSSMRRLANVPFTELKIDGSFVRGVASDPACRAMVETSLELARKLGIDAVAEGVESTDVRDLLRQLACPLAQGFHFAKPMPAAAFLAWAQGRGVAAGAGGL